MDFDQENLYNLRYRRHKANKNFYLLCALIIGCFWIFYELYGQFYLVVIADWFLPLLSRVQLIACGVTILGFLVFKEKLQYYKIFQTLKVIFLLASLGNAGLFCYLYISNEEQMSSNYREDFYYSCSQLATIISVAGALTEECRQQRLVMYAQTGADDFMREWFFEQYANLINQNGQADQQALSRISVESVSQSQLNPVYGNTCTICNEETDPKGKAVQLPCMHIFHPECIREWIAIKQFCPNCREVITAASDSFHEPPE